MLEKVRNEKEVKMVSKENSIKFVLSSFLSLWILFIGIKTILWTPVPMGESDDYMLTTVSLQYEHNLGLHEADILNYEKKNTPAIDWEMKTRA